MYYASMKSSDALKWSPIVAMGTQCDSIDIAKLRDFALGLGDLGEVSISRICLGTRSRSCEQGC
jgi:hypothetical protein